MIFFSGSFLINKKDIAYTKSPNKFGLKDGILNVDLKSFIKLMQKHSEWKSDTYFIYWMKVFKCPPFDIITMFSALQPETWPFVSNTWDMWFKTNSFILLYKLCTMTLL